MTGAIAHESISTWRQPTPEAASVARTELVGEVADEICDLATHRLRIAVDGLTAAGKTSFGHELAEAIRARGRPTLRASLDDFKHPWSDAAARGYDRVTGEGYYRNAPDIASAQQLLLEPAGPHGSGRVVLCGHDPLTGQDHRSTTVTAPADAVLVVDGVFALRPEYDPFWDLRVWLDVPARLSMKRGVERDAEMEGGRAEAERLHRERYHAAEQVYIAEVDPIARADVRIDNTTIAAPIRRR